MIRLLPTFLVVAWAALTSTALAAQTTYDEIAPLLAARCVMCHSGPSAPLGLHLDSFEATVKGSQRGPVVRAGDAQGSELMKRLTGKSQPRMPMTGPPFLSDAEIATFERWISGGLARGAGTAPAPAPAARPKPGEAVTYAHVAPIFATRCAKCHTDRGIMGAAPEGYRLTSYEQTLSAADRARVVPGKPLASELLRRVRGLAQPRMPFDGPPFLTEDEITLIEAWIAQGARDAQGRPAPIPVGARVRLHGILGEAGQLDGLPVTVTSGTRIDKRPRPGDYAELRGTIGPGGEVIAERIRRR